MTTGFDVVVLAGGQSLRFGADKLAVLLDDVLDGLPAAATSVVCVGPPRPTRRTGVRWTREEPPLGGPLAGVAAGVALTSSPVVVVVGGDMPAVGRAVPALVAVAYRAGRPGLLRDTGGRRQPLASAWPRTVLLAALARVDPPSGRPLRALLDPAITPEVVEVTDVWAAATDVDVPDDLTAPGRPAPPG